MSVRFICIEVRKNLCCANVFLKFEESLTDIGYLRINVEKDSLRFRENSMETYVDVSDFFTTEACSISNLTVDECNASFRLTVDHIKDSTDVKECTEASSKPIAITELNPRIHDHSQVSVVCQNCLYNLSVPNKCLRIREFPSGSLDVSDFFCHHGPNLNEVLVPKVTDLFYGFQFVVLNRELFEKSLIEKEAHLYCTRCLQYMGEPILEGKAVKLWTDTLRFKINDEVVDIFDSCLKRTTLLLLHKVASETNLSSEPFLHQVLFSKVVLEATFPSRKCKYLQLQLLEKDLQVLRNSEPLTHSTHSKSDLLKVRLEYFKAFKLLYRLVKSNSCFSDEGDGQNLFQPLDMSTHTVKISPKLFVALLSELECNSLLLSEAHRYIHKGFQQSYLFYKN